MRITMIHLFTTAAQALLVTLATLSWTAGTVAISNQVQASLDVTRRQTSVAIAIVLTRQALTITRTPAAVVRTFRRTDAS